MFTVPLFRVVVDTNVVFEGLTKLDLQVITPAQLVAQLALEGS